MDGRKMERERKETVCQSNLRAGSCSLVFSRSCFRSGCVHLAIKHAQQLQWIWNSELI